MNIERRLIKEITTPQEYQISFNDLVKNFDKKLKKFDPLSKAISIEQYFKNNGIASARKDLVKDRIIDESWLKEYITKTGKKKKDFQGLYIFYHLNNPIYVGISKGVINRILQHVKGHSHSTSTLAYNLGIIMWRLSGNEEYAGGRKEFDFKSNVTPAKDFIMKQRIAFLHIPSHEELYTFEVYCAMQMKCLLNKFTTH